MCETGMEQDAGPTPWAKRLRLLKCGVILGVIASGTLFVWAFVIKVQEAADRIH
jgi:hypothetical protein